MPAQNLDDVLSFVAKSLRKDEKPIRELSDYKTGLHYHEAFLQDLEGLEVNALRQNGDRYWLRIARLSKEPPPPFPRASGNDLRSVSDVVANERWVTVPDDPNGTPTLKNSIRLLLPTAEARKLETDRLISHTDYGEPNATGRVMVIDIFVPHGVAHGKTNPAEATVIAAQIEEIARDLRYQHSTIGVISLNGAEQAAAIEREIINRLGPEVFGRFELLVADSSGFQGKERSIMFLSMADAPNRRTVARVQDIYAQRYNVALSRAKDRMYLVHSISLESLKNAKDMRRLALQHFSDPMPTEVARKHATDDLLSKCDSNFERDVLSRLLRDGFDANPQFPAAGYKIDIVVDGADDRRLAIELDGDEYHPPEQYARDMERQQQLERIGFKFWRCWYSEWILSPDSCYADLRANLDALDIKPSAAARRPKSSYSAAFIADTDGKLFTPEEYAARSRERNEHYARSEGGESVIDAEFIEVPTTPDRTTAPPLLRLESYSPRALPIGKVGHNTLGAGDMVVVQIVSVSGNGECRTRNLEITFGAADDLTAGRVGIGSELGRLLSEAAADDCFECRIADVDLAVTVVAIRRAA